MDERAYQTEILAHLFDRKERRPMPECPLEHIAFTAADRAVAAAALGAVKVRTGAYCVAYADGLEPIEQVYGDDWVAQGLAIAHARRCGEEGPF